MYKLVILMITLLLFSVVGCSSGDSIAGPDTNDQTQSQETSQKVVDPGNAPASEGDPDELGGGFRGPQ